MPTSNGPTIRRPQGSDGGSAGDDRPEAVVAPRLRSDNLDTPTQRELALLRSLGINIRRS